MITETVINIVLRFLLNTFNSTFWNVRIPGFSDELMDNLYKYLDYFTYAGQFIGFFVPMSVFKSCLVAVLLLFAAEHLYPVIMWVIHKIPLSID